MEQIKIPDGYQSSLNLHDTQIAIKTVKDFFQQTLAQKLNLLRVSAPVFVNPSSGLNDNLNGVERPVSFDIKGQPENAEIVHSLAKWKRYALQKYGFAHGEGLNRYTIIESTIINGSTLITERFSAITSTIQSTSGQKQYRSCLNSSFLSIVSSSPASYPFDSFRK